jgi:RND family efflux transporter MFP subunit
MLTRNLLALTALLAACGAAEPQPTAPSPTEARVAAAPSEPEPEPEYVGVVTAKKSTIIAAPFRGRFNRIDVHLGSRVKKDDKIARLDDTELKTQIEGFKAEERAASAQSGVGGAQAAGLAKKLIAQQKLVQLGALPPMALTQTRAEMDAASAQGGAAAAGGGVPKSKRLIAEAQLAKAEMSTPIDGVVAMVKAKEGEVVEQGQTVAKVSDPTELNIRFALPKERRDDAVPGTPVKIRIDGIEQALWGVIDYTSNDEPALGFVVVVAKIVSTKLPRPNELLLSLAGRVTIEKRAAGK